MITKEYFCKIIKRLTKANDIQEQIYDIYRTAEDNIMDDFQNGGSLMIAHEDIVVNLLNEIFQDSEDVIGWWIYDLDYGRKFKIGAITHNDGYEPDLSTAEKLYDYLIEEMRKNNAKDYKNE